MSRLDASKPPPQKRRRQSSPPPSLSQSPANSTCPYLSEVNIKALDFDLRPICSVTLTTTNIYICLTCGRYLQGRSAASPAHKHSLEASHHLFLNYATEVVYCLPDAYPVSDPLLARIADVSRPKYTSDLVATLDITPATKPRLRGAVPLQKLHPTDYANAVVLLLLRPPPVRDYLLLNPISQSPDMYKALAELCRKLWASDAFRDHISPHHLMHTLAETPRFGLLERGNPVDLLAHLLNSLQSKKHKHPSSRGFSDVLKRSFRGKMRIETTASTGTTTSNVTHFWYLPLELPPKPLFRDASERTLVPQVPLSHLLSKYDGVTTQHVMKTADQRTHHLLYLPDYLLLVVNRFSKSKFGVEKNPTVVHLPPLLDLSTLCEGSNNYHLIASITHDGTSSEGDYRIAMRHDATGNWHEFADTNRSQTQYQLVSLADSCILLYERVR